MRKFIALPTWLIIRMASPFFSSDHPWKHKRFTLEDWYSHQTYQCQEFDVAMWVGFLSIVVCVLTIWRAL